MQRHVALETQRVAIEGRGEHAERVIAFVCESLACVSATAAAPVIRVVEAEHEDDAILELMRAVTLAVVDTYSEGLAIHAAAIATENGVILFPAASGVGKSTLAVDLCLLGQTFLTDELVFIRQGDGHALARPAHLKAGSSFMRDRHPALRSMSRCSQLGTLIPAKALGAPPDAHLARKIAAVVVPHYDARHARASLTRLDTAESCQALLGALVNARNLPTLGVPEVAALVAAHPVYRLDYCALDDAREELSAFELLRGR
jgi:hypothetical protein